VLYVAAHGKRFGAVRPHERERVGRDVDTDDGAVLCQPRAIAAGSAARVEEALAAAEPRTEEIADEAACGAVPPVVVFDRGDAGVFGRIQSGEPTAGASAGREAQGVDHEVR
jgi:hypothetical protein